MKRIAFIAMSGVRAHNAELTQLGLTLPGFVDRNKIIASLPSLGLLTLAGLTPDKFEVSYHEIADLKTLPELPVDFDLVAISTFTAQFYEACDVADFYRARNIPVVMGGITVSSLREQAKEHCASVVIGEGERLWPELLADFERGALKPFYVTNREFDLADAPLPRFLAWRHLGATFYEMGKFPDAEKAYIECLKLRDDDVQVLNNLAYLYTNDLNQPEKGLPLAEKAAELMPDTVRVLDTYAWTLCKLGRLTEAEKILLKATRLEQPLAVGWYHLGWVYEQNKRYGEAARQYRQAVEMLGTHKDDPLFQTVKDALERVLKLEPAGGK